MTTPKMPICDYCGQKYEQDRRGHCAHCGAPFRHANLLDYFSENEQEYIFDRIKYCNFTAAFDAMGAIRTILA